MRITTWYEPIIGICRQRFSKKLDEGMKGTMADYQIALVSETPLMDVYPYSAEPNDKPEV